MNLRYLLPCACGNTVPVEPPQAGGRVRCECGAELEVPTLLRLKRLEPAEPPQQAVGTAPIAWGARQRTVLVGTVVSAIGLALAITYYAARPKKANLTLVSPLVSLMVWESLKMGVDVPPTPYESAQVADLEYHYRWVAFGLGVAVIGAGILVGSLLVRKPPLTDAPLPRR